MRIQPNADAPSSDHARNLTAPQPYRRYLPRWRHSFALVLVASVGLGSALVSVTPSVGADQIARPAALDAGIESLKAAPAEIAGAAARTTVNRLSMDHNGQLRLHQERTRSRAQTLDAIEAAQQQGDSVAVGIDHPVESLSVNDPLVVQGTQWSYAALDYDRLAVRTTGAGAVVAVVDSGLQHHQDLVGQSLPGIDLTESPDPNTNDDLGHGTHISGIIAARRNNSEGLVGIAPDAKVIPVKVLDNTDSGTTATVVNGILWAAARNVDAINISVATSVDDPVLRTAVQYAISRHVVVVASVGNGGLYGSPAQYPGSYPEVLSVGASTRQGAVADYSTSSPHLDVVAPGDEVVSTLGSWYEEASGTSMAAAHVSGLVAALRALKPESTVDQIIEAITMTAVDIHVPGFDARSGHGLINPGAAAERMAMVDTTPLNRTNPDALFRTKTTVETSTPLLGGSGQVARIEAKVANRQTGSPVANAEVIFYSQSYYGRNSWNELVFAGSATTDSQGVARWSTTPTESMMYSASTTPVIGRFFGSDSALVTVEVNHPDSDDEFADPGSNYGNPSMRVTVRAVAKKKRIKLRVSPNLNQRVTVQMKKKRGWRTVAKTRVSTIKQVRLRSGKRSYRVRVEASGGYQVGVAKVFRG